MKKPEWPKWAPPEAIEYCDSIFGFYGASELQLLLTHSRAELIWSKLARFGIDAEIFCKGLLTALGFPESNKTPAQFSNHLTLIAKKAYELAILIDEVPSINSLFLCQHQETWAGVISKHRRIIDDSGFYRYHPANLVETLMFITDTAEQHTQPLYEKPNVENAHVLFFIKSMDDFFRKVSRKPHSGITLLCTELLFPDYPVSKKSIEKATLRRKLTPTK